MRNIDLFSKQLVEEIRSGKNPGCADCPLFGKTPVIADSYNGEVGPVDILFMGLNPGKTEALKGLPFIGLAGAVLRDALKGFDGISWAITNSMLCSTPNQNDIPDIAKATNSCRPIVRRIASRFSPRIYVPLGGPAMGVFGITGGVMKNSGVPVTVKGATVIPLIHPSAARRPFVSDGKGNMERFLEGIEIIKQKAME